MVEIFSVAFALSGADRKVVAMFQNSQWSGVTFRKLRSVSGTRQEQWQYFVWCCAAWCSTLHRRLSAVDIRQTMTNPALPMIVKRSTSCYWDAKCVGSTTDHVTQFPPLEISYVCRSKRQNDSKRMVVPLGLSYLVSPLPFTDLADVLLLDAWDSGRQLAAEPLKSLSTDGISRYLTLSYSQVLFVSAQRPSPSH